MGYFIGKRNIGKMTYERSKTMLGSLYGTFHKKGEEMGNKVLYIETNNFMQLDRYFTITIAYQEAEYALKDSDEWERFTSILKKVMKDELTKGGDKK